MALPDLDTSEISYIGFWNHLDNGATSINPMDATSAMDSYKEYTNGVDGQVSRSIRIHHADQGDWYTTVTFRVRVKDDGWIIAWKTPTQEYDVRDVGAGEDVPTGKTDIIHEYTNDSNNYGFDRTKLSNTILALRDALDSAAGSTFNHADVSYYNYEYPDATTLTIHGVKGGQYDTTVDSGVTLYEWIQTLYCDNDNDGEVSFGSWGPLSDIKVGVRDALANGYISAGGTVTSTATNGVYGTEASAVSLIAWA